MKRLFGALLIISAVTVVGCGKKKNNGGGTTVVTPQDCYNNGMNPAYWGDNVPFNRWNTGWNTNQNNGWNTNWDPNNVGCVGVGPNHPNNGNFNYNQFPVYYVDGVPLYYVNSPRYFWGAGAFFHIRF